MLRFKSIVLLLGFLILSTPLYAQLTINGTVTDAKTGETLPGVNVYLSNTTIGTSTDAQGTYQINNIPSGIYLLVFSFVGYKTKTVQLKVKNASSSRKLNATLQPHTFELEEVQVTDSNKEWSKNYERFERAFLGKTLFAKQTSIENPWVISFSQSTGADSLIASANKPVFIINRALGYKIYAELVEFKWSKYQDVGVYKIHPKFEPLSPQSKIQERTWWQNRIEAYLGSLPHFLKILYRDSLKQSPFSIKYIRDLSFMAAGETRYELFQRGFSPGMFRRFKGIKLHDQISVNYINRTRYQFGDINVSFHIKKQNDISANSVNESFFIDENGKLLDPASVTTYGDWARSRVANSLPDNYEIGD